MEYYVFKDSQNLGPMGEAGVVDGLRSGRFQPNDLACRVGESNWQDLSILFPFEGQRQASPGRTTGPVYQQAPAPQPQPAYQQPAPIVQLAQNPAQANYPGGDFLLGQRFGALLIDAACAIPLVVMAVIPLVGIIGAPLLCAYWISRDSFLGGQSIGKKALGLKVIKPDGSPFTWADSVKRNIIYFGYLVLLIPWLGIFLNLIVNVPLAILELVMVLTNGQRLGDRQGGTFVVRA